MSRLNQAVLQAKDLRSGYDRQLILKGIDIEVNEGEICALLGPSGCGKTTLLKSLAGLVDLQQGQIRLRDRELATLPPEQRNIGLIFQDYALFPHLTVRHNVEFGLFALDKAQQKQLSDEMLSLVGLTHFANRFPHELSGGQQQRVAIARALARKPELLLLDEPFSNIDPRVRAELIAEVRALLKQQGIPAILVTHNKDEAFALADRILVLDQGKIAQQGSAEQLYQRPNSRFVAELLGSANWLPATGESSGATGCALGQATDDAVVLDGQLLIRPHQLVAESDADGDAVVKDRQFQGGSVLLQFQWQQQTLQVEQPVQQADLFEIGSRARLSLAI